MPETNDTFLNNTNNSGFLFQMRIEQEIETNKPGNWQPIAHEHRWRDPLDGKEGFVDLILEYGIERMVIECKKTRDASWIFLVPDNRGLTKRSRFLWTYEGKVKQEVYRKKIFAWHDFSTNSNSLESSFCIVRGQGEKDAPMLERLSGILLRSVERLATEELEFEKPSEGELHFYIPVIITIATLFTCRYDTNNVSIISGELSDAVFEEVPFIRFRKNLSTSLPTQKLQNLQQANKENERTIFVINSNHIVKVLSEIKFPYELNAPWPWENLRSS